ncbi:MAG: type 4a pilus biogenesis protein PilO [Verrucomicrobia bacterium]|nr:type 4a pilus biogenesis protein PilO [Verrucomicrobiota bacterium]
MSQFLDKLNLRPQEKRLVVLGSAVLFVVLNFWLVWPHASDLRNARAKLSAGRAQLRTFQTELDRAEDYALRLRELEGQGAGILPEEEQSTKLIAQIQSQASRSGVSCNSIRPQTRGARAEPTEFFEEQSISVTLNPTGPDEILDFLLALASGNLVVRVKELDLKPDPSQTKLTGSMRLVASFQKNAPKPGSAAQLPGSPGRKS